MPGTRVINGFANQRPWDNGTEMLPDEFGFSRHYYTSYSENSYITKENPQAYDDTKFYLDATGKRDGEYEPFGPTKSGTIFVPSHVSAFPERWFYAYQTEFVTRDIQPFKGPFWLHGRFASPGGGVTAKVWMTEVNTYRLPWIEEIVRQRGLDPNDPRLLPLSESVAAKSTLRHYTFYAHKGVEAIAIFATHDKYGFGVVSDDFITALRNNNYRLTNEIRAKAGPQLAAVKNVYNLMKQGQPLDSPRKLKVDRIVEHKPRLVFEGDGTPQHPSRYHADDFAVLPFQLDDRTFAIGCYVVTRDIRHSWDSSKDLLDPDRYRMPDQEFELTLSNVNGSGASVSLYDPILNANVPAEAVSSDSRTITVKLKAVDYPRFLVIEEAKPGPLIQEPLLERTNGGGVISFTPNKSGTVEISWGPYPVRKPSAFRQIQYADERFQKRVETREVELLDRRLRFSGKGSWEWTGTFVPPFTENYRFVYDTDHSGTQVWLDDQPVIKGDGEPSGNIGLTAGRAYTLKVRYSSPYDVDHWLSLHVMSPHQYRNLAVGETGHDTRIVKNVTANRRVYVPIEGLRPGDGVKITFTSENLVQTFPQWDEDVRFVVDESTPLRTDPIPADGGNVLFFNVGMGVDLEGQNVTTAALRAVREVTQRMAMPGLPLVLPHQDINRMRVRVRLAVPANKEALDLEAVKAEFPNGQVTVEAGDGGMLAPIHDPANEGNQAFVAIASIQVGYD